MKSPKKSKEITEEKKLMESEIFSEPQVVDFRTFSASLFEGFDPEKFKDSSRKLRGSGSGTGGSSQSGSGGSSTGGGSQSGSGGSGTAPGGGDKGKNSTEEEMDKIYDLLRAAVRGPITKEDKLLQAIKLLKSRQDLITLDNYIRKNDGYFSMPIGKDRLSLQDILNDELEGDEDDLLQKIGDELYRIGVIMEWENPDEEEKNLKFVPNTIKIKYNKGASGSW